MTKICFRCKQEKPQTDFSKCSQKKDGLCTYCRPCDKLKAHAWKAKNVPRWKAQKINASLISRRGITLETRNEMLSKQGGNCGICRGPMARPHVDHDHKTGKIRGLLCYRCNSAIGLLKDSIPNLQAAIDYLKQAS